MSDLVLDASLTLQWFLEDEHDREYSLAVLQSLTERRALVPLLWYYEVGNGLLMAYRRKRIALEQISGFLARLQALPIDAAHQTPTEVLSLPALAQSQGLTNYDAAYVALALQHNLPLATTDGAIRRTASVAGVRLVSV